MRYHDPARPKDASGFGKIVAPDGRVLGALQCLMVEPFGKDNWEVRVHLQVGVSTFREYSYQCEALSTVSELLLRYQEYPEGVLERYFHYDFKMETAVKSPPKAGGTTLADLGLE